MFRSLPLSLLPTPLSTENVVFGKIADPLATMSCGGPTTTSHRRPCLRHPRRRARRSGPSSAPIGPPGKGLAWF
ncbi:hypothetical protein Acr_27g0000950 [Actinidia rufa]|uniref:Uncharacterized protein n=1 Tax=Actinidia rufa TaxID=165716 RepID=A0A7J0H5H8_9ERIC|nr:hypothetical protein Acr_27g0000950 [Actinidia rufa]